MVVRRKRKRKWRRGERTYHGSHKKWRGKGSRGGRGLAGLHKHKWSYAVKYLPEHFGKRGFKSVKKKLGLKPKAINLQQIDELAKRLEVEGKLEFEKNKAKIELKKFGFEKVLGRGKLTKPLIIIAKQASELAKRKIEEKGGKLILRG